MPIIPFIVPECYVDTNVVETLLSMDGIGKPSVNHQKGCNVVVDVMQKRFKDEFAVGIIDNDKRRVSYLDKCIKIVSTEHFDVYRHREFNHYLFVITPAMDGLLFQVAKRNDVDLSSFGLPSNMKAFKDRTKCVDAKNDSSIKSLIKELSSDIEIQRFTKTLVYLVNARYGIDEEQVKSLMA